VESPESYIEKRKAQLPPVAEGSGLEIKDLQLKRPGAIHHAVAVKIGASMTRNIQSSAAYRSFADVYGSGWNPNVLLTYEFQPFHSEWFGNVGFVLGTGVAYQGGQGAFQYNLENPAAPGTYFGSSSRTKFQFFAVPLLAGVNYRFNLLRVLRPYVQFTPTLIGYKEARSDGQTGNRGYSKGFYANGGVNILLDWMDRKATWSLYETQGVKHYYLTVDYSQLTTFASEVSFNVSGVSAGLTYEF
jgi:hypothetical protein